MGIPIYKIVGLLISSFVLLFIVTNIKKDKPEISKSKYIVLFVYTYITLFISNFILPLSFKMFVSFILILTMVFHVHKLKLLTNLFYTVTSFIILLVSEIITTIVFMYVFNIDMKIVVMDGILYNLMNFLIVLMSIIFVFILKSRAIFNIFRKEMTYKQKIIFYLIILFSSCTLFINASIIFNVENLSFLHYLSLFLFICFLTLFILLVYEIAIIVDTSGKLDITERYNKKLEVYNNVLQNKTDELRMLSHEYNNNLTVLRGYIVENNYDNALNYILKLHKENKSISSNNYGNIKDSGLKSLLIIKSAEIEYENIKFETEIIGTVDDFTIDINDICKIIGIFLDNAIDAAKQTESPMISLCIAKTEQNLNITVINSINDTNIDTEKIFKKGYSSKGNGRGYGLNIVKEIVEKHKELTLDTYIENQFFIQDIVISNKAISLEAAQAF